MVKKWRQYAIHGEDLNFDMMQKAYQGKGYSK